MVLDFMLFKNKLHSESLFFNLSCKIEAQSDTKSSDVKFIHSDKSLFCFLVCFARMLENQSDITMNNLNYLHV